MYKQQEQCTNASNEHIIYISKTIRLIIIYFTHEQKKINYERQNKDPKHPTVLNATN